MDFSKSLRSNPPLWEGPLEISNRPRSMGGYIYKGWWYRVTLVLAVLVRNLLISPTVLDGGTARYGVRATKPRPMFLLQARGVDVAPRLALSTRDRILSGYCPH